MRKLFITSLCLLSLVLAGCGFHLRQPSDLPTALHHMQLKPHNVNEAISSTLRAELTALHAKLDKSAPITLVLSHSKTDTDIPVVFNANADTNYTYTLSVHAKLINTAGKVIAQRTISASETVLHNVNQVSPPVFTPLMRSTLTQQLVDNIYTWLSSGSTIAAINASSSSHHAK